MCAYLGPTMEFRGRIARPGRMEVWIRMLRLVGLGLWDRGCILGSWAYFVGPLSNGSP